MFAFDFFRLVSAPRRSRWLAASEAFAGDYANPDRPGIADGSTVVRAARFQVETGRQQEFRDGAGLKHRRLFTPTLLRFGLRARSRRASSRTAT